MLIKTYKYDKNLNSKILILIWYLFFDNIGWKSFEI